MTNSFLVALIASVAHEVNRAYCASIGDDSQPAWAEAPQWQKDSAIAGVNMHLANPQATPEQSHESWLAHKLANGWIYGEVKNDERKEHPCCVPYDQLPPEQKSKDYLFRAVVHALKEIPLAQPHSQTGHSPADQHALGAAVAVRYIGARAQYTDRLYGTGLVFKQGQVRPVPPSVARRFLRHVDLFEQAAVAQDSAPASNALDVSTDDTAEQLMRMEQEQQKEDDEQFTLDSMHRSLDGMNREALELLAPRYGVRVAKNIKDDALRDRLHKAIDAQGIV